jgi:outer membrane murein-binding lipoprotein Lpp
MTRYRNPILLSAAVASILLATGCTDLKPLQSQVDDLKAQVSKLSAQEASTKSAADSAASAAQAALAAAQRAQSTANAASAAAAQCQRGLDETNEKIARMFKKSISK